MPDPTHRAQADATGRKGCESRATFLEALSALRTARAVRSCPVARTNESLALDRGSLPSRSAPDCREVLCLIFGVPRLVAEANVPKAGGAPLPLPCVA